MLSGYKKESNAGRKLSDQRVASGDDKPGDTEVNIVTRFSLQTKSNQLILACDLIVIRIRKLEPHSPATDAAHHVFSHTHHACIHNLTVCSSRLQQMTYQ